MPVKHHSLRFDFVFNVRDNFGLTCSEYHRYTRPRIDWEISRTCWRLARQLVPASLQRQRVSERRAACGGAR